MFITGFLHSGVTIVRDFLQDISPCAISNAGDECYFLRENHAGVDKIYYSASNAASEPLQSKTTYKLYLMKSVLLGKLEAKGCLERFVYNKKCITYWKNISNSKEKSEKLELVKAFYSRNDLIYLNAITLDMPGELLENLFAIDRHVFPIRNIYSQLKDIEECDYFFGPFNFNVEYILGRKDLAHVRRSAYLDTLSYRLQKLEYYKKCENIIIIDVESLLTSEEYRKKMHLRLDLKYVNNEYNTLNLKRSRPWLQYSEDDFLGDENLRIIYSPIISKIRKIQDQIDKLKCG